MEKYFIDYNIATEKKNPDSIFILTGCLDKRIFSQEKSNTIDVIAKPILDAVPLRVMSGYGLPCYDREGNIYLHPIMKEIAPTVKRIYKAVKEFQEIMSGEPLLYEIKKTGLTINTKQVRSLDQ
jgi:hypothetical protein